MPGEIPRGSKSTDLRLTSILDLSPESAGGLLAPRHSEGLNVAFVDGHVTWQHPEHVKPSMFDPDWMP